MLTEVSRVEILSGELRISKRTLLKWSRMRLRLPEIAPIDRFRETPFSTFMCPNEHEIGGNFCSVCGEPMVGADTTAVLNLFSWCGAASENTYTDGTLVEFLLDLEGDADLVFEWLDFFGPSGVRKKRDKVTFHQVVQTLGNETKHRRRP